MDVFKFVTTQQFLLVRPFFIIFFMLQFDKIIYSYTDRNFVAKYSQQVLHFDHEVTY